MKEFTRRHNSSARRSYTQARERDQAAFDKQATDAGHGPRPVITTTNAGPVTQYVCTCGAYRSLVGTRRTARQGWVSHVMTKISNPQRVAS